MTVYASSTTPRPRSGAHRAPRGLYGAVWSTLTAALTLTLLGVGGHIAWTLHHDRAQVAAGQAALTQQLDREWNVTTALVAGVPQTTGLIGRMTIPKIGGSWVLVEGVELWRIKDAPGHFPATTKPGQRGNASFAGHREAGMWGDLDKMRVGDPIVIQTKTRFYVYRVTSTLVTLPNDVAQIAPVPPGMTAGRLLTLMTCAPRFDNTHRLWVHAVLERTSPSDEIPPELT